MRQTQVLAVIVMMGAFFSPLDAQADLSMVILSETYHVSGHLLADPGADWTDPGDWIKDSYPGEYRSYDLTVSSPPVSGEVRIGVPFHAGSMATRDTDDSGTRFYTEATSTRKPAYTYGEPAAFGESTASLSVDFMLRGSDDLLSVVAHGGGFYAKYYHATLADLVTGQSWTLLYADDPWWPDAHYEDDFAYWNDPDPIPIDQAHVYRLVMGIGADDRGGGALYVDFLNVSDVRPIPAPGAALLGVLGLGTAAMRLRRRYSYH